MDLMRTRVLPPLILCMCLLVGAFIYVFYHVHEARLREVREVTAERAAGLVTSELRNCVSLMSAALEVITRDRQLADAFEGGDRALLLSQSRPLFEKLRAQF